jgi:hypothetical protein
LPVRKIPRVKVLSPSRPRLSVSTLPALVANNLERGLSEAPLPLLLPPQDDLSQHKLTIVIFQPHNYRTFVRHKEDTNL